MQTGQRVAITGMAISAMLAAIKIGTGMAAHSNSVLADGFESAGDVLASGLVLLGLTLALKPADSNHPYGHGRAEILTGLLLGFILFSAGVAIAVHALVGVSDVRQVPASYAVWPLILSIGVKAWLLRLKFHAGRNIGSASLVADAWNDGLDMVSGVAALIAVSLTLYDPVQFLRADHYGGFAVGLIVILTGVRVASDTGMQLMDTMPDDWRLARIREVAMSIPGVEGVEKCFARKTGFKYHVDLHIEVNPGVTVFVGHDIASQVRDALRERVDWVADVLVHVEPTPGEAYIKRQRTNGM